MPERFPYDRSSKWLIQHHGNAMLRLGGLHGSFTWRPLQAELVQPRQLPDGLLEVRQPGRTEPDYFILEIESYPDRALDEQILRDLTLVYLDRGVLPEVLVLVLRPKGIVVAPHAVEHRSRLQWTHWQAGWRVVELWTLSADEALALNELGIVPWVPLMQSAEPPEVILQRCRERIDHQATAQERPNLLAVTQVLSRLRYNDPRLLAILGGPQAVIESPLIQELLEQRSKQVQNQAILRILTVRFGPVPADLADAVKVIQDDGRLAALLDFAVVSSDLEAFRQRLYSGG